MRESLTDEHVMHRLRANMRDAPLIAVKADWPPDPASRCSTSPPVRAPGRSIGASLAAPAQPARHPPAATSSSDRNQRIENAWDNGRSRELLARGSPPTCAIYRAGGGGQEAVVPSAAVICQTAGGIV